VVNDAQKKSIRELIKVLCFTFLGIFMLAGSLLTYAHFASAAPKESRLIANFHAHRRAFEQLRDMMQADREVWSVAERGVEVGNALHIAVPPEGNFPLARYNTYLALLKETGGEMVSRHGDGIGVLMWGAGFGGDTIHLEICWQQTEPPNQIASVDAFHKTDRPGPVFQRIEGNWYLWSDW